MTFEVNIELEFQYLISTSTPCMLGYFIDCPAAAAIGVVDNIYQIPVAMASQVLSSSTSLSNWSSH